MWMLIGLAGLLAASSMVDLISATPSQPAPGDGTDDDTAGLGANADLLQDEEGAGVSGIGPEQADLLRDPFLDDDDVDQEFAGGVGGENSAEDIETPDDLGPGLVSGGAGASAVSGASSGWEDDEFISSDTPAPPPERYYIDIGDEGDAAAGGNGDDVLEGGAGADWLDGLRGSDQLLGGDGDDSLHGGLGDDTLLGGAGSDDLTSGGGQGLLIGGSGDDSLTGGEQDDTLMGGTGDDSLHGGWGNDVLTAGTGNDLLMGGAGEDTLFGFTPDEAGGDQDGADFLNGGAGNDVLVLGSGDHANGGEGADTFVLGDWVDPQDVAQITDFDPAQDSLTIAFDAGAGPPQITTLFAADLGGLQVLINGEPVAFLSGVEALDSNAITLLPVDGGPQQ